jgi:hypothetical protein
VKQRVIIRGKRGKKPPIRQSKFERRQSMEQKALHPRPCVRTGKDLRDRDDVDDERPGRDL